MGVKGLEHDFYAVGEPDVILIADEDDISGGLGDSVFKVFIGAEGGRIDGKNDGNVWILSCEGGNDAWG